MCARRCGGGSERQRCHRCSHHVRQVRQEKIAQAPRRRSRARSCYETEYSSAPGSGIEQCAERLVNSPDHADSTISSIPKLSTLVEIDFRRSLFSSRGSGCGPRRGMLCCR